MPMGRLRVNARSSIISSLSSGITWRSHASPHHRGSSNREHKRNLHGDRPKSMMGTRNLAPLLRRIVIHARRQSHGPCDTPKSRHGTLHQATPVPRSLELGRCSPSGRSHWPSVSVLSLRCFPPSTSTPSPSPSPSDSRSARLPGHTRPPCP